VVLSSLMNLTPSTSKDGLGLGSKNYVKLLTLKLVLKSGAERCIKNSSIWELCASWLIGWMENAEWKTQFWALERNQGWFSYSNTHHLYLQMTKALTCSLQLMFRFESSLLFLLCNIGISYQFLWRPIWKLVYIFVMVFG
jgi:hypothetical protein